MPASESMPAPLPQDLESANGPRAVCVRSLHIIAGGALPEFEAVIHPKAVNREAVREPKASRGNGPAAFYATALWLRAAFSDLRFDIHEVVADGDLVAVHITMHGRHTGPFVHYDKAGAVSQARPPTGRTFAATHTHWFRLADGKIIEHWANRDDLATAQQAGWIPPSPRYLVRMAVAKRRARAAMNA